MKIWSRAPLSLYNISYPKVQRGTFVIPRLTLPMFVLRALFQQLSKGMPNWQNHHCADIRRWAISSLSLLVPVRMSVFSCGPLAPAQARFWAQSPF